MRFLVSGSAEVPFPLASLSQVQPSCCVLEVSHLVTWDRMCGKAWFPPRKIKTPQATVKNAIRAVDVCKSIFMQQHSRLSAGDTDSALVNVVLEPEQEWLNSPTLLHQCQEKYPSTIQQWLLPTARVEPDDSIVTALLQTSMFQSRYNSTYIGNGNTQPPLPPPHTHT